MEIAAAGPQAASARGVQVPASRSLRVRRWHPCSASRRQSDSPGSFCCQCTGKLLSLAVHPGLDGPKNGFDVGQMILHPTPALELRAAGRRELVQIMLSDSDFVEWDVPTWSRAIALWDEYLNAHVVGQQQPKGLELGAHYGGLTLYMAGKHGVHMVCSDLKSPRKWAHERHESFGVGELVEYSAVDALNIDFPAETFDYVIFKSLLGEIGPTHAPENKPRMIAEVHRVLKPGGAVLFAENMIASPLHQFLRKKVRKWGGSWGYTRVDQMLELLSEFEPVVYRTTGFLTAFAPGPRLKRGVGVVDSLLDRILPENSRYVIYGYAVKPATREDAK